jgi:hypothetical protein
MQAWQITFASKGTAMPEPTKEVHSESEPEKLVAKAEESLTPLYETRFHPSTVDWVIWAVAIALLGALAVLFPAIGLRKYLEDVRLGGGAPDRGVVWFFWGFTAVWIIGVVSLLLGPYVSSFQRFTIHLDGVLVKMGKKTRMDLRFGNIESARVARWWEAFTKFASGFSGHYGVGILILVKQKLPYSFWVGGGSRLVWIGPDNPETFLKELNGAWDRWRLAHEPKSSG